jgi:hypothetical protein
MDANIFLQEHLHIENDKLAKMIFIYNALENGWTIKKRDKTLSILKTDQALQQLDNES